MLASRVRPVYFDLFLILLVWSILIATMVVLQSLGFEFGFNIWPIGEFRNWIELLQDGPGVNAAKLFWTLDHRNALSPWWYLSARPLIESYPAAPLILHLVSGLFVGIAAYLLMAELTGSRPFALSVGMLSAIFLPNVHRDEIIWNFVGALGCTLICIWLFALFCADRNRTAYISASLAAWFISISTYTIQIGAIGAIFFVSLRGWLSTMSWPRAITRAVADVAPYIALLILYMMLWITTSSIGFPDSYQPQFSFAALSNSIAFGFWNSHYATFWVWSVLAIGPQLMAVIFGVLAILIGGLLHLLAYDCGKRPALKSLAFAFLIGACVVAPTVGLEAVSDIWTPGTRWPMVMQFWTPFVFCILAFAAMVSLSDRLWSPVWKGFTSCASAFVILLALGFNHTQIVHVRQERTFFAALQSVVSEDRISGLKFPRRYFIQPAEPLLFLPVGRLADVYAHTILGRDVTFEIVDVLPEASSDRTLLIWQNRQLSRPVLTKVPIKRPQ
jgi:hypothetical protein